MAHFSFNIERKDTYSFTSFIFLDPVQKVVDSIILLSNMRGAYFVGSCVEDAFY